MVLSLLKDFRFILFSLGIILFLYPSFTWDYINYVTPVAFFFVILNLGINILKKELILKSYFFIYVFYYYAYSNIVGSSVESTLISTPILVSSLFLLFPLKYISKIFYYFYYILGVFLIVSITIYLSKFLGFYSPELKKQLGTDGREYMSYPFNTMLSITIYSTSYVTSKFYRYYAFLNEPGFIGTISSLIVFAFKFDFKNNKFLYVYLISSILSMSLASYLVLFIGTAYFISFKRIIYFTIPFAILISFNYSFFERFIISRLEVENGELSGDNRTSAIFDKNWEEFLLSNSIYLGKGKGQHVVGAGNYGGVASWKSIVYNTGLIGLLMYISIFISIFLTIKKNNYSKFDILFLLVFLLTIYHRPNIQLIYYLLILFGGLLNQPKTYEN